jgi:hypothetical protein
MLRIDRVLSFFSSRPNWDSPSPSHAGECCIPPSLVPGGHTWYRERGWGVPVRTRRHTLCYSRYKCTLWYCVCTTGTRDQGEGWSTENPKLFLSGTVCVSAGEAGGKGVFSVYTQPNHIGQSPNIVVFTKTTCPVPLFYSFFMRRNY